MVTEVQISSSNRPSDRQNAYDEQARRSRRIAPVMEAAEQPLHDPVRIVDRLAWRDSRLADGTRAIPEETALAMTYNGSTYAVMMGTPQNLTDFAIGFCLSEGIVQVPEEISSLEIVDVGDGIELRMWLSDEKAAHLGERRRYIAGPTGCGLCGIDSIAEVVRPPAVVGKGRSLSPCEILTATASIFPLQPINIETRAVHAAAFWTPASGIVALREDVGRHNALDKLAGALAQAKVPTNEGAVLLTSRVSVEMVQKTAVLGATVMVAVSAPTALAIRMADEAGITLVAVARSDGFEIFTHPDRVLSAIAQGTT